MKVRVPLISRMNADEETNWIAALSAAAPKLQFVPLSQVQPNVRDEIEVAIVANPDPADVATFANLKWVQSLWAGIERLMLELPDGKFEVSRLIDPQLAQTMAEAVLAWTLYLHRDMPQYGAQQIARTWKSADFVLASDRKVGVLGMGKLGTTAAHRLIENGFDVTGWNNSGRPVDNIKVLSGNNGLDEILAWADILVVLLPLTPQTSHLLDRAAFSKCRKGAQLINFGRGRVIDDAALVNALDEGHLDHAVLDVFAQEPLPQNHPFWGNPKVTVLPHISAPTNMATAAKIVADNLNGYFENGVCPPFVDKSKGY